ncbi:hypothetical protein NTE_01873 [Candidatus Nitrososphaera evergladensis SR1]|uniref:Uncharacterized protein n=1 Tax=Candidatus Nitrososphaera evergladensis SR1 TaxID=1459636 RepID=A0A075MRY7_9ARCH|nr:hypothetical protein NTE_01873 [Candidatus Nitrososphaera evergladensis SR1]
MQASLTLLKSTAPFTPCQIPLAVKRWAKNTPVDFRYTAKMHRVITHAKAMSNCDQQLETFYSAVALLREKLLCILIQLPSSIGFKTGFRALQNFGNIYSQ